MLPWRVPCLHKSPTPAATNRQLHTQLYKHKPTRVYCRRAAVVLPPQDRKDAFDLDDDPEAAAEAEEGEGGVVGSGKFSWSNTDREYTYDELLGEGGCLLCFSRGE